MTKKDKKEIEINNKDDIELEEILKNELKDKEKNETENYISKLKEKHLKTKKELKKYKEIATTTQSQYINLKNEFDLFTNRINNEKEENKIKNIIDIINKILPFIDNLSKSLEHIPEEFKDNNFINWIILTYKHFQNTLETMWVFEINSIWEEADPELHQPLWLEQTNDKKLKWKIIKEIEKGYIFKKNDTKKVIRIAKVIVWE